MKKEKATAKKKESQKVNEKTPVETSPMEEQPPAAETPKEIPVIKVETQSDVSKLEQALSDNGSLDGYLMLPSEIERLWKHARVKDELVKFFQEKWKPKNQFDPEKIEYNQIIIVAEYVMFNIIFAKNELMFDEYKTAMLVTILWKLLEYDPNVKQETPKPDDTRDSQHNI